MHGNTIVEQFVQLAIEYDKELYLQYQCSIFFTVETMKKMIHLEHVWLSLKGSDMSK